MADTFKPDHPIETVYAGEIDLSKPHFVGVSGTAMSAVAMMAAAAGSHVTGSDARYQGHTATLLREAGVSVFPEGNSADHAKGASCVVYTTVTSCTPEAVAARAAGIPVVHRAQVLNQLAAGKRLVAVIGSHGKTTTAAMLATGLADLRLDLSYLVGAELRGHPSARVGHGDLFVAEIDESDRSFLCMDGADLVVIPSLNDDHPETYAQAGDYLAAMVEFCSKMRPGGALVANGDDPGVGELLARLRFVRPDLKVITYGRSEGATWLISDVAVRGWNQSVTVDDASGKSHTLDVRSPAVHYGYNAVAATAAAVSLGADADAFAEVLACFGGARRRFERLGNRGGVSVVECFASHPREVAADLTTAKQVASSGDVWVVFQPSGYVKVKQYGRAIGHLLAAGSVGTYVLPIHGVGDSGVVDASIVRDAIEEADGVALATRDFGEVSAEIAGEAQPGDVVLIMGTGDVFSKTCILIAELESAAGVRV